MRDVDAQFLRGLFDEEGSLHTAGRTALYRLYGPEGLLYVGISVCPLTRIRTHLRQQPWASQVIGVRIDYPYDAEAAEREAVWSERPLYNVVFNGTAPPPPPDGAARLRTELATEQRRLAEFEAAVPESPAHLRLLTRGIAAKQAKIARLVTAIEAIGEKDGARKG
ncbi:GIY-YIG nuclease family protein [Streptomyces lincolnensis]|uniref:GIY-YIG nuclease family protein n=1 Tax=Streptomyces lincolnensis TaxID=1915 RepID=UPI001E371A99|nr:GIY-YIG nuclease family protein [Streptomyces lincolnensis]MCD7438483.1 GIY-YIG nuclease family protein [Streptomyces lincolnensis]